VGVRLSASRQHVPHSREAIAEAFAGLDAAFIEQVTATNCKRLYGFA
jgi:hypothetical protein